MADVIHTDQPFSAQHRELLGKLSAAMIPASGDAPAASDAAIAAHLFELLAPHQTDVVSGLDTLCQMHDDPLGLTDTEYLSALIELQKTEPLFAQHLQVSLLTAYYQHPAALSAINVDPRPPHPAGRTVDDTDWSLLDPVKARQPFYREV